MFVARVKRGSYRDKFLREKQTSVGSYLTGDLSAAFKRKSRALVERKLSEAEPFLRKNERLGVDDFEIVEVQSEERVMKKVIGEDRYGWPIFESVGDEAAVNAIADILANSDEHFGTEEIAEELSLYIQEASPGSDETGESIMIQFASLPVEERASPDFDHRKFVKRFLGLI